MRPATTEFVRKWYGYLDGFPGTIVDIGGSETDRQFSSIFDYEVWDLRLTNDCDRVVDVRSMVSDGTVAAGSVGTLLTFDMLEHIFEFHFAVPQMCQAVRSGGLLIIAVPWQYPFHDASADFWRFSHLALEKLFHDDFETIDLGYYDKRDCMLSSYYIGQKR